MNLFKKFAAPLLVSALSLSAISATTSSSLALDPADRPEIEKIIKEYLLSNPQLLQQMQQLAKIKQEAEQVARQQKTLIDKADIIYSSKNHIEIGKSDAKYTVVEFFDYNCPFCQRAMYDMEKVLESNPDVKFVIKEWPVLGQNSFEAHNVSLAFNSLMPEKYTEFHEKLLALKGQKGESIAIEIAVSFGADEAKLRAEMNKPHILETLRENNGIAEDLGITGTPSYIIGNEVVFGAVGVDAIVSRIDALRKKK